MILRISFIGSVVWALAAANPLTITVNGTARGMLGTTSFPSSAFTFTMSTDTSLLQTDKLGIINTPIGTATTFSIADAGSGTFTDDQHLFVDPNSSGGLGGIGFRHFQNIVLIAIVSPKLVDYTLTTNLGPLTEMPYILSTGTSFRTSAGLLSFTYVNPVTFTVVVGTAPTPLTPSITGVGLPAGNAGAHLAPGVPITVTGANLGTGINDPATITVGGKSAPVLGAISTSSLLTQVPVDVPLGATTLIATYKGQSSTPFNVTVDAFSPAIYDNASSACMDSTGSRFTTTHPAIANNAVTCSAIGLGTTNPPMITGIKATALAPTTTPVQVMVGGKLVRPDYVGLLVGSVTDYQVSFKLPADVPVGNQPLFVLVAGKQSNTVTLSVGAPIPSITAIANGARFTTNGAAPNSFVSIFGTNLGLLDTVSNISPATDFNGLSVLFNGVAAPLYFVFGSLNQINLVTPSELPESGLVTVQVKTAQGTSATFPLQMASADVGVFRITDPSNAKRNNGAVLFANTAWRVMPLPMATALGFPSCDPAIPDTACGKPAKSGDVIQIYVTGLGKATQNGDPSGQPLVTGTLAPASGNPLYKTVQKPTVTIGGRPAALLFSGIAPGNAGLYQVNVTIPDGLETNDEVPVVVTMPNGSKDTVTIAIQGS
jgi:uncharacterized protein (TIGR03437 family)